MSKLDDYLKRQHGGRVLDIATGRGDCARYLDETMISCESVLGIDNSDKGFEKARERTDPDKNIKYEVMDATNLTFDDDAFDTVAMSDSLHHMADAPRVLAEMKRVLKPGGLFVLIEMIRDDPNEMQLTHILLHHWWASVDRVTGVTHNSTFSRDELKAMVATLDISEVEVFEESDYGEEAYGEQVMNFVRNACDQYLTKIEGKPEHAELYREGVELKERLEKVGLRWARQVSIVGRK